MKSESNLEKCNCFVWEWYIMEISPRNKKRNVILGHNCLSQSKSFVYCAELRKQCLYQRKLHEFRMWLALSLTTDLFVKSSTDIAPETFDLLKMNVICCKNHSTIVFNNIKHVLIAHGTLTLTSTQLFLRPQFH